MSDLTLHHYPASPYAEKIRAILGYKGLRWNSVQIPMVMPKPDLMPLTGGYRKTPVLQIGRDIILDTALIARLLDRLYPDPPLVSPAQRMDCLAYAGLEQSLFFGAIGTVYQPEGLKALIGQLGGDMQVFSKDRQELFAGGSVRRPSPELYKTFFLPAVNAINAQLANRAFLLGDAPSLADFVCWHPVWFVRQNAGVRGWLDPFHNLLAWEQRMLGLGQGQATEISAEAALTMAREGSNSLEFDGPLQEPGSLKLGDRVVARATDYGGDPVEGVLIHASIYELVLRREDPRAGTVNVHLPRQGFSIGAA